MILDIIPLHDRWSESSRGVDFSTYTTRVVSDDIPGNDAPIGMDENYYPLGRYFDQDCSLELNRYKVIERFGSSIYEYMCLSYDNINVDHLKKYNDCELIPIWCIEHNALTGNVTKHYFPEGINEILYEAWLPPSMNFKVDTVRNAYLRELRNLSQRKHLPEIDNIVDEVANKLTIRNIIDANDENDVDTFFDIGRRILPVYWDPTSACLPWVRTAVLGAMAGDKLKEPNVVNANFCQKSFMHKTDVDTIRSLIGLKYNLDLEPQERPPFDLDDTVITSCNECGNDAFYAINKYIEQLPYTYFSIHSTKTGATVKCYDKYMRKPATDVTYQHDRDELNRKHGFDRLCFEHLDQMLRQVGTSFNRNAPIGTIDCQRSSNDDVYITYVYDDGRELKFYFDLVYVALGTRGIMTDYECSLFLPNNN